MLFDWRLLALFPILQPWTALALALSLWLGGRGGREAGRQGGREGSRAVLERLGVEEGWGVGSDCCGFGRTGGQQAHRDINRDG